MPTVHGHRVRGVDVDPETRCVHYDSPRDVVAIRFACCDTFYPCFECHEAVADHDAAVWPAGSEEEPAVLCGVCGRVLTVREYVADDDACPDCGADFNPGCREHYPLYFHETLFEDEQS